LVATCTDAVPLLEQFGAEHHSAGPHQHLSATFYTYVDVDGNVVQAPVEAPSAPAGATAHCKDGTWSFSQHRSGTCSGHGGVADWL
jgi:hypothetical protein